MLHQLSSFQKAYKCSQGNSLKYRTSSSISLPPTNLSSNKSPINGQFMYYTMIQTQSPIVSFPFVSYLIHFLYILETWLQIMVSQAFSHSFFKTPTHLPSISIECFNAGSLQQTSDCPENVSVHVGTIGGRDDILILV